MPPMKPFRVGKQTGPKGKLRVVCVESNYLIFKIFNIFSETFIGAMYGAVHFCFFK